MCQFRNGNTSYFYKFVKCHRCRRNAHGPVPLNNEQRFKFAMSTYTRAAHHLWSALDLCSHGIQRQSLWIKLTAVSIAKSFTQINSISRNSEILRFYTLHWKNNVRSPTVPLDQPSWVINTSEPKTSFEAYLNLIRSIFNQLFEWHRKT